MKLNHFKFKRIGLHVSIFAVFLLYNNCSGFTAKELASINTSSSVGTPGTPTSPAAPTPIPTPIMGSPMLSEAVATPSPGGSRTKVFVAQGRLGRTLISCDGGHTWIHDQSFDDNRRCWMNDQTDPRNVECDHNYYAGVGVDSGDGWIYANYGWGAPGTVRRSSDGLHWQTIRQSPIDPNTGLLDPRQATYGGGLSYSTGKLLLLWSGWFFSDKANADSSTWSIPDLTSNWYSVTNRPPDAVIADHAHAHRLGNKYVIVANSGIAISSDLGQTWTSTPSLGWPPVNIAEGNGHIVAIGAVNSAASNTLHAMSSSDGGVTWTDTQVLSAQYARWGELIFDGTQFVSYDGATRLTSPDGINWTPSTVNVTGTYTGGAAWVAIGAVGYNSVTKTYVTITTEWGYWYDRQRASVSNDGINWTELDATHFKGGHPIGMITTADIDSRFCQ